MINIYITTAKRNKNNFDGLQQLISSVFTDEDANGNNGEDYYVNGEPFDKHLEKLVKQWHDSGLSERVIISKAFASYQLFCKNYYAAMEYDFLENRSGFVTVLTMSVVLT